MKQGCRGFTNLSYDQSACALKTRSIQFPEDLNEAMVKAAEERQVSFNWLCNQLCREGLARLAKTIKVTT